MAKIETGKVAEILKKNHLEPGLLRRIVEEINLAVQPDPEEEKAPAVKKQFIILISDPDKRMQFIREAGDFAGWVLQIPESESPATTLERIHRAAYDYNATKKGRLYPAKTVGEAIENVPAKFFKAADLWVRTKVPVLVVRTDNEIPRA